MVGSAGQAWEAVISGACGDDGGVAAVQRAIGVEVRARALGVVVIIVPDGLGAAVPADLECHERIVVVRRLAVETDRS